MSIFSYSCLLTIYSLWWGISWVLGFFSHFNLFFWSYFWFLRVFIWKRKFWAVWSRRSGLSQVRKVWSLFSWRLSFYFEECSAYFTIITFLLFQPELWGRGGKGIFLCFLSWYACEVTGSQTCESKNASVGGETHKCVGDCISQEFLTLTLVHAQTP